MASSSSPYSSQSAVRNGPGSSASARDANNFMNEDNLLKLALKKPKSWKWELTTSSSSPSISFPKIQLFDSRTGEMMVQVDKPDCVVKSEELVSKGSALDRSQSLQERKGHDQRYRRSRSTCIREKVTTSSEFLSDVFAQLQGKGMGHKLATSVTQYRVENEEDEEADGSGFGLQKSQSAKEIRRSWSLEQKKKVLKSPPNRSGSMLGKISESYKTSTEEEPPRAPTPPPSPEPTPTIPEISVVEEPEPKPSQEGDKNKIYKLVRSNVGTLIVREESFHTQRSLRRRRQLLQKQQALPESEPQQLDQRITIGDIPDSSYNDTIKEIDSLISKVMLSHTLQDVQEPTRPSPSRGRTSTVAALQNGGTEPVVRKRRSRRSASAGSNASSYGSRRSQRSSNSPLVTAPTGSSSSDEDSVSLAESRFGSLKRRGRAKYKRNSTGQVHEVYGGLVNGSGKQHESYVRRSNTGSSNNSTTVEIEECESLSLGSFRSSGSAKPQTIVKSSEKSSSTSLSTLSSPSPAAEATRNIRPNRWGTHEATTPARDPERVQQKTIEIESRFQKNDAQSNTDLSNTESLSKYHDSKSQFSSRNSESIIDSKVLITREAVTPSREPERVLQNAIEIKSRFKKDDAHSNSSLSVEACESLNKNDVSKSHYTSEKLESIVDSNVVMTEADLAQLKNDIIEHSTKTFVNNKDTERRKSSISSLPEVVVKTNESSEMINGCDESNIKIRDRERSQQYAPTADTHQSKNKNPIDESFSGPVQHKPTEDCNEFQHESELNVTAGDVRRRSPISRQTFGSFQFPRHIDASNTSSTSLAWSYLPQLSTSHSTSSLASLRSNSCNTAAASQSPVQRRQLKSYAQRHHRSSFHVLPN